MKKFVSSVARSKGQRLPHVAELLQEVLGACGGPKKVARLFADGLEKAQSGTLTQQKYLDCLWKLILYCSKTLDAAQQEEGLLNDADLEREILALVPEGDDAAAVDAVA